MSKVFYPKLAASNIKKNAKTYVPYILTCTLTIMMYYIIRGLGMNSSVEEMHGGQDIIMIMGLGSWVIIIFSVIFLFYTNSFLIKRRKKEFGLFNILGMEKRHLGRVVFWETLFSGGFSLLAGIASGILFSHLVYLLLMKMLRFPVSLGFEIAPKAIGECLFLFAGIFLLNYLNTLRQIHLSNPIELLKGSNVGEKEPKTKWIIALVGFLCLGVGYYIAATVTSPLDAMLLFFGAVILVIIGTYCLFTAGSILILKILRKNKRYYYQPKHFTTISGMMYRMKQNAAGLASICVLSTGVLILISTTLSLYLGLEDSLRWRYPRNIGVNQYNVTDESRKAIDSMVNDVISEYGIETENVINYRSQGFTLAQDGNHFYGVNQSYTGMDLGDEMPTSLTFILLEDYNRLEGREEQLAPDEVLVYCAKGETLNGEIQIQDTSCKIKENLSEEVIPMGMGTLLTDAYCIVVPDQAFLERVTKQIEVPGELKDRLSEMSYYYGFDTTADEDTQIRLQKELSARMEQEGLTGYADGVAAGKNSFYIMDGGLLFLGIFLGLLFVMATILIIYYKQISEGYDDRERYQIMKKVGMSKKEVRQSIRSQELSVFFLPLLMAGVHIAFAFNIINRLLMIFNLYNTKLFMACTGGTIVVFALGYTLIYSMTAKTYYKIVS